MSVFVRNSTCLLVFAYLIQGCGLFEKDQGVRLIIQVEPELAGSVIPSGGMYSKGENIELFAIPEEHYVFTGWSGDFTGSGNPTSISMNKNLTVIAHFERKPYPLTVQIEGNGTVEEQIIVTTITEKTTEYPHGTLVHLTAIPAEGWGFAWWSGDQSGTDTEVEVTVDGPTTITAAFYHIPQFTPDEEVEHRNAFHSYVSGLIDVEYVDYSDRGLVPYNFGVVWSETPDVSLENNVVNGIWSHEGSKKIFRLDNMSVETTYYYRIFATNEFGTFYSSERSYTTDRYNLGGPGQARGVIFYIDRDNEFEFAYLEAAPDDWSGQSDLPVAPWGCSGTTISPPSGIGAGPAATQAIIDACSEEGIAARLADNAVINGFDDWYLPSALENGHFYYDLSDLPVGLQIGTTQWSSTEAAGDEAPDHAHVKWHPYSITYIPDRPLKNAQRAVRPVRAFNP